METLPSSSTRLEHMTSTRLSLAPVNSDIESLEIDWRTTLLGVAGGGGAGGALVAPISNPVVAALRMRPIAHCGRPSR